MGQPQAQGAGAQPHEGRGPRLCSPQDPTPAAPGVSQSRPREAPRPMPAQLDSPAKRLLDFQPPQLCQPQPPLHPCCPRVQDQKEGSGEWPVGFRLEPGQPELFTLGADTRERREAWCCLPGRRGPPALCKCGLPVLHPRWSTGATGLTPHCDRLTAHKQDKAQDPWPHPQALQGPAPPRPTPQQTQTRTRLASPPTLHVARNGQGTATLSTLLLSRALDSHTAVTTVPRCPLPAQRGRRDLPRAGHLWHCVPGLTPRPAPRQHQALGSKAQSQPKSQPRPEQERPRLPWPVTAALGGTPQAAGTGTWQGRCTLGRAWHRGEHRRTHCHRPTVPRSLHPSPPGPSRLERKAQTNREQQLGTGHPSRHTRLSLGCARGPVPLPGALILCRRTEASPLH